MKSRIVEHIAAPDRGALEAALAERVRFHSPVADYRGRDDVVHLLCHIATVLRAVEPTREVEDGPTTTTFFEARVGEHRLSGVLDEHHDARGRVTEATLMLRPLGALRIAVQAMAVALERDPLPSTR